MTNRAHTGNRKGELERAREVGVYSAMKFK